MTTAQPGRRARFQIRFQILIFRIPRFPSTKLAVLTSSSRVPLVPVLKQSLPHRLIKDRPGKTLSMSVPPLDYPTSPFLKRSRATPAALLSRFTVQRPLATNRDTVLLVSGTYTLLRLSTAARTGLRWTLRPMLLFNAAASGCMAVSIFAATFSTLWT